MPRVTPTILEGFLTALMTDNLDTPCKTPPFHREMWSLVCSENENVAIAAPRGHAKTTAVTMAYVLANALFNERDCIMIVSSTYDLSAKFLSSLKSYLYGNVGIIQTFGPFKFDKDTEDEIIVKTKYGKFCIVAKGSEQGSVRGFKWGDKRPNLIIMDDGENDEIVNNPDRRRKFKSWFMNVLTPSGNKGCLYRVVGTILHFDSLLENLLNDDTWLSKRYSAHKSFDDFSDILWPEMWSEERLRKRRQSYINQGNTEGYSQEYLNIPVSVEDQYFRPEDMLEMTPDDHENHTKGKMSYYVAADLAITKGQRSDYTVIGVMGVDAYNYKHIVDIRKGRWDSLEIIDELLAINRRYRPELFGIEVGQIEKAIGPFLDVKMRENNEYLNLYPLRPAGDKPMRAKSFQAMMKSGSVKFDKEASWYMGLEDEMMKFTNSGAKSGHDDQIDVMSYLGIMVSEVNRPPTIEEESEEEYFQFVRETNLGGRNQVTGY